MRSRLPWRDKMLRQATANPYRSWLKTEGSLTRRLQTGCKTFRVERIKQGMERPLLDEPLPRQRAWVREVLLYRDGQPVVFAHSVLARLPRHPLDGLFRGLGNRALGTLLFTDLRFHRLSLTFLQIDARHPLYRRLVAVARDGKFRLPASVWVRRALFVWQGKTLWVTEVFLPTVLNASTG